MRWYDTANQLPLVKFRVQYRLRVVRSLQRWLRGQQRIQERPLLCAVLPGHHRVILTNFSSALLRLFRGEGIPAEEYSGGNDIS